MPDPKSLVIPPPLQHPREGRTDAGLAKAVKDHYEAHPGVRFLADVLTALHAGPDAVRTAAAFHARFAPRTVMDALEARPDLRARVVHALTGTPASLLRRMLPMDVAAQIELLVAEDVPNEERQVRAADDRPRSVVEIYLKYLDPIDLATYLPAKDVWSYESSDAWWDKATESSKRLCVAEIKSIRKHKILSDSEILDIVGNEAMERDLPLKVRHELRNASRKSAAEGKPFTDSALIDALRNADGTRDLIDEIVSAIPLSQLRKIMARAAELLGLPAQGGGESTAKGGSKSTSRVSVIPAAMPSARPPAGASTASGTKIPAAAPTGFGAGGKSSSGGSGARNSAPPPEISTGKGMAEVGIADDETYGSETTDGKGTTKAVADDDLPDFEESPVTDVHIAAPVPGALKR